MRALALVILVVSLACATPSSPPASSPPPTSPSAPAPAWRPLFDGSTTTGWRGFRQEAFPTQGWTITESTLRSDPGSDIDIVTTDQFSDFELELQFRLRPGANSGIKYLIDEALVPRGNHGLGFEYQLIDDDVHPDAKQGKPGTRTCGALYDLIAPAEGKPLRPPGEWNDLRLVVEGTRIEHWLNGSKVLAFQRGSAELQALIADSKYRKQPAFGTPTRGHILLQAHGDEVAFRNIRVRALPAPATVATSAHRSR